MGGGTSCQFLGLGDSFLDEKRLSSIAGNNLRMTNLRRKSWKYILSLQDPPTGQIGLKIFYRYYEVNYGRLAAEERYDPYMCCPVSTLTKEDSRKMNSILFIVRQLLDVNGICIEKPSTLGRLGSRHLSLKCLKFFAPMLRTLLLSIADCICAANDYAIVMDAWVQYLCSVYECLVANSPSSSGIPKTLSLEGVSLSLEARIPYTNSCTAPWSRSVTVGDSRFPSSGRSGNSSSLSHSQMNTHVQSQGGTSDKDLDMLTCLHGDDGSSERITGKLSPLWSERTVHNNSCRLSQHQPRPPTLQERQLSAVNDPKTEEVAIVLKQVGDG